MDGNQVDICGHRAWPRTKASQDQSLLRPRGLLLPTSLHSYVNLHWSLNSSELCQWGWCRNNTFSIGHVSQSTRKSIEEPQKHSPCYIDRDLQISKPMKSAPSFPDHSYCLSRKPPRRTLKWPPNGKEQEAARYIFVEFSRRCLALY